MKFQKLALSGVLCAGVALALGSSGCIQPVDGQGDPFELSVVVTGSGAGSIASSGGVITSKDGTPIQCTSGVSSNCSAEFLDYATSPVTLTAQADTNSKFVGWSGACSGTAPIAADSAANQGNERPLARVPQ